MPITAKCGQCGKTLRVRDELAGRKVRCPDCQGPVTIPAAGSAPAPAPAAASRPPAAAAPAPRPASAPASRPASAPANGPVPCPSCGQEVPAGVQICPACHYHLKLRRKMSIGLAIKDADMHSQGLNLDGSKRVTNAERAEERVEQGRKVGRAMVIAVIAVALLAVVLAVNFVHSGLSAKPLKQLRDTLKVKKLNAEKPESWDPLWTWIDGDKPLELTIPLANLTLLEVADKPSKKKPVAVFPDSWPQGTAGWAAFAEAVRAPAANTLSSMNGRSRYSYDGSNVMETLLACANALGGPYSPAELAKAAPAGPVVVWRQNPDLRERGSLHGAVLAFANGMPETVTREISSLAKKMREREEDIRNDIAAAEGTQPISRAEAESRHPVPAPVMMKVRAKLSFIPVVNRDLTGGRDTYAQALANGASFVRDPESDDQRAPGRMKGGEDCFFLPLLVVESMEKIKPAAKKSGRKKR